MPLEGAFPPTLTRVLNYADNYTLTEAAAGTGAFQVYRTNDVYDPDWSNAGHQPMYFDQLCSATGPYVNFTVPSVEFDLKFQNISNFPVILVMYVSLTTTTPSGKNVACERPLSWKTLLAPSSAGAHSSVVKKLRVNNAKTLGVPLSTYEATNYGTYGFSPPQGNQLTGPFLQMSIWGMGGIGSVAYQVNAKYKTKFFGLGPETSS